MRIVDRRRVVGVVIAVVVLTSVVWLVRPYLRGLAFVVREADMHGAVRTLADLGADTVTEHQIDIATTVGPRHVLAGRLYMPAGGATRMVMLVSGLHPAGINEQRFVALARQVAASGLGVLTPDIPELAQLEITPAVTDEIEGAALWLLNDAQTGARGERIGLLGISFGGGLTVVAAGRPALRDRVAYVLSLGGHDDLPRVLRYLCTGIEAPPARLLQLSPDREGNESGSAVRPPHDYGAALMLLGVVDRLVPPRQADDLRAAVRRFLVASSLDRIDRPG